MKYIISLIVLVLLVVLPALSWYYLRSGYDFRLDLLHKLEVKKSLDRNIYELDGNLISSKLLQKTSLIVDLQKANSDKVLEVQNQFDQAFTYQTVFVGQDSCKIVQNKYLKCLQLSHSNMNELLNGHTFAIVDTGMYVRNWYSEADSIYELIVKHLAVVLPRTPDKDIIKTN